MTTNTHDASSTPGVLQSLHDGVLTLTLNDPGTGNLVDAAMSASIVHAVQTLGDDVKAI